MTATRIHHLAAHLTHVEAEIDRFVVAGPLRDEEGIITGSLLVVKADNAAEAQAFLELDPYYQADIWAGIEIYAFSAAAGDWVGGKTW